MFVKGIPIRKTSILIALNVDAVMRFISREDREIDGQILDQAIDQIDSGKTTLPKQGELALTISLNEREENLLTSCDREFEAHFLEICTREAANKARELQYYRPRSQEVSVETAEVKS